MTLNHIFTKTMKNHALLIWLLIIILPTPLFAWNESEQENVLIFTEDGEPVATYHTGNWSTGIATDGKATYETWAAGSPPTQQSTGIQQIPLASGEIAIPNMVNGASAAPPQNIPTVSLYSFDPAMFISHTPGDTPAISISPSAGTYDHTIGVEIKALALTGSPGIEIWEPTSELWQATTDNPTTITIATSRTLRIRALNSGIYSAEQQFVYTITQPPPEALLPDSDGDGFPDIWEEAVGLDPLQVNKMDKTGDSDKDGLSDIDEILRGSDPNDPYSTPLDSDGDGWSNWDEHRRGTMAYSGTDKPTATRLYEVETILSGMVSDHSSVIPLSPCSIETLTGNLLLSTTTDNAGLYGGRLPVGNESFIRTSAQDDPTLVVKRYLPSHKDPTPADMAFTVADCGGNIETCWLTWQQAWSNWLDDHLVITTVNFNITPASMVPMALLERQLELLSGPIPEEVAEALPVGTSQEPYLAFGASGHRPTASVLLELSNTIGLPYPLAWKPPATNTQPARTINHLMTDLADMAAYSCTELHPDMTALYSSHDMSEIENRISRQLQESKGTYLAGLLLRYSLQSLTSTLHDTCLVLSPSTDLDGDSVANYLEVPSLENNHGLGDLFAGDTDLDSISDDLDNCPDIINPDQLDNDLDGLGDLCDSDDDNDGLSDQKELIFGSNPFLAHTDDDGISDYDEWLTGSDPGVLIYVTALLSPTNQQNQVISGIRETGALISVAIDGAASATVVTLPTATSWSCQLSGMSDDRSYNISLLATSGTRLGHGRATIAVDTVSPEVSIDSPVNDTMVYHPDPLLTYSTNDGIIQVLVDNAVTDISSGMVLGPLADGAHTVTVTATDLAGNSGSASSTFTVLALETGDLNGDSAVNLGDMVLLLQVLTGLDPAVQLTDRYLPQTDNRWGMEEILFMLQEISSQ